MLLNPDKLRVTFEVDNLKKAFELINFSQWSENFIQKETNQLIFEMPSNEIAELNKYFVENGVNITAVIPVRSLEDYFLKITGEVE